MSGDKKKFDALFRALWLRSGRAASIINTPEFKVLEGQYYKLTRIDAKDYDDFFESFSDGWPQTGFYSRAVAEFIMRKYPQKKQAPEPGEGKITWKGKAVIRVMSFRPPKTEDFKPELTLLKALLFKRILGKEIDNYWQGVIDRASFPEKQAIETYIDKYKIMEMLK